MPKLDKFVRQKPQCPAAPACRRASTSQGDKAGLLVAIEHSGTSRYGTTNEDAIKTPFDKRATNPMDGHHTEVQSVADLLVGPRRPQRAAIGFEEDARPSLLTRRHLAFGDERFQLAALL